MRQNKISRRSFIKKSGTALAGLGLLGTRKITAQEKSTELNAISTRGTSAMRVIESYPEVNKKEVSLYKLRGTSGILIDGMVERTTHNTTTETVHPDYVKSLVHTHGLLTAEPTVSASHKVKSRMYLSPQDLRAYFSHLRQGTITKPIVLHLATINEHGKVIGYTSVLFGKKFLINYYKSDPQLIRVAERLCNTLPEEVKTNSGVDKYNALLLELKNHGAIFKVTPAAGYIYRNQSFEKK